MARLIPELTDKQFLRFRYNIDDSGDEDACWPWVGGRKSGEYGIFSINYENLIASRVAFKIANGKDPEGFDVCHSCDNPPCCNPKHLWLGTRSENIRDSFQKGRMPLKTRSHPGSKHWKSKLDEEKVFEIRKLWKTGKFEQQELGTAYGVTQASIHGITSGKTWRHILPALVIFLFLNVCFGNSDVSFTLVDPQFGISQTTNRLVILQAETGVSVSGPNQLLPFKVQQVTSALGICCFSNLYGAELSGFYHVTIPAPPQRYDYDLWVSSTNLGAVQASTMIGVFGASTYPASGFAWTAQVSDARYARATNGTGQPVTFAQLVTTSNALQSALSQIGANDTNYTTGATNDVFVWGNKTFATTNQLERTNAILLNLIGLRTLQSDFLVESNKQKVDLASTNALLLAQITAGGSTNPTNDLSIALNKAQTNSTVVTSNALLVLIQAGGSTNPTNDLSQILNKNQTNSIVVTSNFFVLGLVNSTNNLSTALNLALTNSIGVTSNSLIAKIDATNLVNVAFSNVIANINGFGTNTWLVKATLTNSPYAGVTNLNLLGTANGNENSVSNINDLTFDGNLFMKDQFGFVIGYQPSSNSVNVSFDSIVLGGSGNSIGGGIITGSNNGRNVIAGGLLNAISGFPSDYVTFDNFIGGGNGNTFNGGANQSAIIGGYSNIISGSVGNAQRSVIIGGYKNLIIDEFPNKALGNSVILGGATNYIREANNSVAGGFQAQILNGHDNSFVWNDGIGGQFNTSAKNQFIVKVQNGFGINTSNPIPNSLTVNGLTVAQSNLVTWGTTIMGFTTNMIVLRNAGTDTANRGYFNGQFGAALGTWTNTDTGTYIKIISGNATVMSSAGLNLYSWAYFATPTTVPFTNLTLGGAGSFPVPSMTFGVDFDSTAVFFHGYSTGQTNQWDKLLITSNALVSLIGAPSVNPTNDLNTALIARIAAATNSAQMVFWGTAPDPSGVLVAPKGAIYTFLTNNLPKYQLVNTNGSSGWY